VTDRRYVVLGLAHVRSEWFTEVARWATSGTLPVEFVKCISVEELRARVASGRPYSAALLDGRLPAVDRDLVAWLGRAGVPALVVPGGAGHDGAGVGAAATVEPPVTAGTLLDALADHAALIGGLDLTDDEALASLVPTAWLGRVVAVVSTSGAGGSTLAAATAQHLAADPRNGSGVVLADLAHRAHQALLHDARDVVPGVQELVDAHRSGRPTAEQVRAGCFDVPDRGYRLLLGLRRPGDWVSIRSRAFQAALDGLRATARLVVADVDVDLEGEDTTGSFDIEDRNLMARTTLAAADVVVVVATPTLTGLHGVVTVLDDLRRHGVCGERILVALNRAPRSARARADLARTVAALTAASDHPDPHVGPVFVPDRRGVDGLHRDLARFPRWLAAPVGVGVTEMLDRLVPRAGTAAPEPVVPGSLGAWTDAPWSGDDAEGAS
jgi:hypothetical protein